MNPMMMIRNGARYQRIHRKNIVPIQAPSNAKNTWPLFISLCYDQRYDDDVEFLLLAHRQHLLQALQL